MRGPRAGVRRRVPGAALAVAAVLLLAPAASADLLLLKDGRVVDGVRLQREPDAIKVLYKNGIVRVPLVMVEDYAIEGAPLPEPATDQEREKRAQGLVPYRGRWVPLAAREKAIQQETDAHRKAIEEYRLHKEWRSRYQFKTKNFEFESTQTPRQNEEFSELLESFFGEFSKLWKVQVPKPWGRLKVCFYGSREDFLRTAGAGWGTLAYYRPGEPRELDFYYDRGDPAASVACLFHEASHYLAHLLEPKFRFPHWLSEGMAEYYGASLWDPAKRSMTVGGLQPGRLVEVLADIDAGKSLALRDLVTSENDDYAHYYWGWAFCHFMMESPKYRARFMRFFSDLARAKDVERRGDIFGEGFVFLKDGAECLKAFLSRMGLKEQDLEALQREWFEHIRSLDATRLEGFEEAGLRAYGEGRFTFRAPRFLKKAIDLGSRKTAVWRSYAWCLYRTREYDKVQEARRTLEATAEIDPLDADTWADLGFMAYLMGEKEESDRLVALAREMNPADDYLWFEIRKKLDEIPGDKE